MSRRKLIIGGVLSMLILISAVFAIVLSSDRRSPVTTVADVLPSASASPSVSAEGSHREVSGESRAAKQTELSGNVLLQKLPYDTRYWSLQFEGVEGGKYQLAAVVYFQPGIEDAEQRIAVQRPYIERFLKNSGQPADTYQVSYRAQGRD